MTITIAPTPVIILINGAPVTVYVATVSTDNAGAAAELSAALHEQPVPTLGLPVDGFATFDDYDNSDDSF